MYLVLWYLKPKISWNDLHKSWKKIYKLSNGIVGCKMLNRAQVMLILLHCYCSVVKKVLLVCGLVLRILESLNSKSYNVTIVDCGVLYLLINFHNFWKVVFLQRKWEETLLRSIKCFGCCFGKNGGARCKNALCVFVYVCMWSIKCFDCCFGKNGGARCKNALCVFVYVCMCVISEVMIFEQIVRLWIILSSCFCIDILRQVNVWHST
jgi:hypothetical protein